MFGTETIQYFLIKGNTFNHFQSLWIFRISCVKNTLLYRRFRKPSSNFLNDI